MSSFTWTENYWEEDKRSFWNPLKSLIKYFQKRTWDEKKYKIIFLQFLFPVSFPSRCLVGKDILYNDAKSIGVQFNDSFIYKTSGNHLNRNVILLNEKQTKIHHSRLLHYYWNWRYTQLFGLTLVCWNQQIEEIILCIL